LFNIQLPDSKKNVKLRIPTFAEELKAEQNSKTGFVDKLKTIIVNLDGIEDERKIAAIVPNMSMKDSRYLKDFLNRNTPGVNTSVEHVCESCSYNFEQSFNAGYNFLKLPSSYRENMMEQLFSISYHSKGGITWSEAIKMPTLERIWMMRRINKAIAKENEQINKGKKGRRGRGR